MLTGNKCLICDSIVDSIVVSPKQICKRCLPKIDREGLVELLGAGGANRELELHGYEEISRGLVNEIPKSRESLLERLTEYLSNKDLTLCIDTMYGESIYPCDLWTIESMQLCPVERIENLKTDTIKKILEEGFAKIPTNEWGMVDPSLLKK